jgi:hypothetical protein
VIKAWAVAIKGALIIPTIRSTQKLAKEQAELWYGEPWDYMETIGYSCVRIRISMD